MACGIDIIEMIFFYKDLKHFNRKFDLGITLVITFTLLL